MSIHLKNESQEGKIDPDRDRHVWGDKWEG
jgi:hypothetical protein